SRESDLPAPRLEDRNAQYARRGDDLQDRAATGNTAGERGREGWVRAGLPLAALAFVGLEAAHESPPPFAATRPLPFGGPSSRMWRDGHSLAAERQQNSFWSLSQCCDFRVGSRQTPRQRQRRRYGDAFMRQASP